MARGARQREKLWRPQLTAGEKRLGWVFFALYLFAFPFLIGGAVRVLDERLGIFLTPAQSAVVYYLIVLAVLVAAFWEFLHHALRILRQNLQGNLLSLGVGVALALAGTLIFALIPLPVENPVYLDYPEQLAASPVATVLAVVLLRPAVEELLYRGLLFGSLRKSHRALAYALSAGIFALAAVWQYAFPEGGAVYLLLTVRYLPLGLALTWCYDIGGSVYTPLAARILAQAVFLALAR